MSPAAIERAKMTERGPPRIGHAAQIPVENVVLHDRSRTGCGRLGRGRSLWFRLPRQSCLTSEDRPLEPIYSEAS